MDFRDFTISLALGELNNLTLVEEDDASMLKPQHRAKVLTALNQGLKALCSRFIVIQKEALIQSDITVSHYYLRKEFAQTNTFDVPLKYILDSEANPFIEDLVKILGVYDNVGDDVFLNDLGQDASVFTSQYDCLQMPYNKGQIYSVIYQAYHPVMVGTNPCQEIHIPPLLEEALHSYVAGKVFSHMNGAENSAKGAEHMANYNAICDLIENKNLLNNSTTTSHTKLEQRGFV